MINVGSIWVRTDVPHKYESDLYTGPEWDKVIVKKIRRHFESRHDSAVYMVDIILGNGTEFWLFSTTFKKYYRQVD